MRHDAVKRGWSPTPETPDTKPWYRYFWVWFVIFFPTTAVVAGLTTVWISMQDRDGLVADDYYKAGLAINRTLEREETARRLGLSAGVRLDLATGGLAITMGGALPDSPAPPHLHLIHATRAHNDVEPALLRVAPGHYVAQLDRALAPGAWQVALDGGEGSWRLSGRVQVRTGTQELLQVELIP